MEHTEDIREKLESKKNSTTFLVRCSQEQKEILQKSAAESGKNAAQFFVDTVMESKSNTAFYKASESQKKEFAQIDTLIERLSSILRAKMITMIEQENQLSEQQKSMAEREHHLGKDYEEFKDDLEKEYILKEQALRTQHEDLLKQMHEKYGQELQEKEALLLKAKEKIEDLEGACEMLTREKNTLQTRNADLQRSQGLADDRLIELHTKNKELEEKARILEPLKDKNHLLERNLIHAESALREETFKREFFEKELYTRRNAEVKKNTELTYAD
jgi:uncharacterized protein (DUF1778 family)